MQKRQSFTGKEDSNANQWSGPKGLCKEAEFPPVFILMPGFKVKGAGERKDLEAFIKKKVWED